MINYFRRIEYKRLIEKPLQWDIEYTFKILIKHSEMNWMLDFNKW